jgi:hypothetical protein
MPIVKRPNLRDRTLAARLREDTIKAAQKAAQESGIELSNYEKNIARQSKWERLGAEKNFYSQSGLGSAPWEQKLLKLALLVFLLVFAVMFLLAKT